GPREPNETTIMELQRRARDFREALPGPGDVVPEPGGWRDLIRQTLRWMVTGFRRSRANDLAAAVAYYALLAIVPTILALISVIGLILRSEEGYRQAVDLVLWIVPEGLTSQGVETLPRLRDQSAAFGLASLAGFLWIGSTFFAALGRAMNRVYRVPDRPPVQQRVRGFVSIIVFSVLFTVSVIASTVPTVVLGIDQSTLPLGLERWPVFTGLYQVLSYLIAVLVAILLFGVIFRIVPAAHQEVEDIVPGAVVIGIAFVIVAQIFPVYLRIVSGWNLIGGTAGLLSLVLIWFYVLAHLFLFGAYINATWQRHRNRSSTP
ncbi:MAG TPA: YihY/virulence factor BrkB family protein, partial [Thermomicrobiales bacterium]|nr:YihY/virulence factor BrkB family protein [Thermomicrobiales bacterium]